MRTLIDKRGVKVLLPSDNDLRPVVQLWNEKTGNFGEFSLSCGNIFTGFHYEMLIK